MGWTPNLLTSGRRRNGAAFPQSYGAQCGAHDANQCDRFFPLETMGIWCCRSWCYVDEACPSANPSLILPGHYWSYAVCRDDGLTLANCQFSEVCRPTGDNSALSAAQR